MPPSVDGPRSKHGHRLSTTDLRSDLDTVPRLAIQVVLLLAAPRPALQWATRALASSSEILEIIRGLLIHIEEWRLVDSLVTPRPALLRAARALASAVLVRIRGGRLIEAWRLIDEQSPACSIVIIAEVVPVVDDRFAVEGRVGTSRVDKGIRTTLLAVEGRDGPSRAHKGIHTALPTIIEGRVGASRIHKDARTALLAVERRAGASSVDKEICTALLAGVVIEVTCNSRMTHETHMSPSARI